MSVENVDFRDEEFFKLLKSKDDPSHEKAMYLPAIASYSPVFAGTSSLLWPSVTR